MKKILTFLIAILTLSVFGQGKQKPKDFLPKGYVVFEEIKGDLNKDNVDDCILIIKGTDTSKMVTDEYKGKLDRNRRGVIILFKKNGKYELALKNYHCFSSEVEDGGVYYAPDLIVSIRKGNLYFAFGHGRYGYWKYTFRFQKSDFELIGYDLSSNQGPVVNSTVSINFSTKIIQEKENTNEHAQGGDEVFKTTTRKIKIIQLLKLSKIKDFDDMDMSIY